VVARRVAHAPWWAGLGKRWEAFAGALPYHRDSRSGRRNANQIRLALLSFGILVVVFWQSPWAPAALLLCLSALVLPISESKRRQLVASARAKRKGTRVERVPGVLSIEEKHVTLMVDGERERRLRRTALRIDERDDGLELVAGKKKVERVLILTGGESDEDFWVESNAIERLSDALR
jgi:hypothetical protein